MGDESKLADRPANLVLSDPELLADGYRPYQRYQLTLRNANGEDVRQTRDVMRGGKVVAVLPVDVARDEIVLIRQFRLPAHLANGLGDLIEIVAGRVESGEKIMAAAQRECWEEIGVKPRQLIELFSYLTTPGLTDEEVTVFLGLIDASQVSKQPPHEPEDEQIETLCVPIDVALAALEQNDIRNGPAIIALQWLGLHRGRLGELSDTRKRKA